MNQNSQKVKLRWLYICPNKNCGNIILKSEKYIEGMVRIKCQKCGRIFDFNELLIKRI